MSRRIKEDFEKLLEFFDTYTLKANISDVNFKEFLSVYHKRYYAYLTFIAELSQFSTRSLIIALTKDQYQYYSESCSDCGLALFDAVNGNYKGARLLLRSSIENFIKGICLDEDSSINSEKSVYELFDRAKAVSFFSKVTTKNLFDVVHQQYKDLCKDVHTATFDNMVQLSALNTLPVFDKKLSGSVVNVVLHLIPAYVTMLSLKYNKFYHSIYYENKEIIQLAILSDYAEVVNNLK